ncbi:MAG: hypothetical protein H6717_34025 [Polyangiaceae bacterium]|nr:hypothetical protein [Polyangiaceae bacterium]
MLALELRSIATAALCLSVLNACGSDCDAAVRWSIVAHVRDANTGAEICNASGVAQDGPYQEDLTCFDSPTCSCNGVGERLGTYEVTISAPGYQSSKKTVVVDDSDACHVETVHVEFKLDPQ